MDPVSVPASASIEQLLMLLLSAAVPVLIAYLEKLRRDLAANTQKTESISHSVNGSLDARLRAMADDIKAKIEEEIAENYIQLEKRLDEMDKRLVDLERKAKG
jgi:hypothetical protein